MKAYIASSWFNPVANKEVDDIKQALEDAGFDLFSPRDHLICPASADGGFQKFVYDGNVTAMKDCDFMIANTHGKDMGTLHESGYFSCLEKPIIYFAAGLTGQFNLMLSQSGIKVCVSVDDLRDYLVRCKKAESLLIEPYLGLIE